MEANTFIRPELHLQVRETLVPLKYGKILNLTIYINILILLTSSDIGIDFVDSFGIGPRRFLRSIKCPRKRAKID